MTLENKLNVLLEINKSLGTFKSTWQTKNSNVVQVKCLNYHYKYGCNYTIYVPIKENVLIYDLVTVLHVKVTVAVSIIASLPEWCFLYKTRSSTSLPVLWRKVRWLGWGFVPAGCHTAWTGECWWWGHLWALLCTLLGPGRHTNKSYITCHIVGGKLKTNMEQN